MAASIDISQYRSRIGTFSRQKLTSNKGIVPLRPNLKTNTIMESFIMLAYLLVLSNVTQKLLIISGVELNPGPSSLGKKHLMEIFNFSIKTYPQIQFYCRMYHLFSSFLFFLPKYPQIKERQGKRQTLTMKFVQLAAR